MSARSRQSDDHPAGVPRLLVELEPRPRVFLRNLWALVTFERPHLPRLTSLPAPFWPDVFVNRRISVAALGQSLLYHTALLVAIWGVTQMRAGRARVTVEPFAKNQTISYFEVSEYLPSLSGSGTPARMDKDKDKDQVQKGEPAYAKQPIISLPQLPDNRTQTIVNPSAPKLLPNSIEVKLPNLVAWTNVPAAPAAAAVRSTASLTVPADIVSVVQPAPEASQRELRELALPKLEPAIVEPAPAPDALKRKLGDINVGHFDPHLAAPNLPVPEQQAATGKGDRDSVPPPPPSAVAGGGHQAVGQLIALGLNPTLPAGPIDVPQGSRHGTFAAGPEGKPGAPGTPEIKAGGEGNGASGVIKGGGTGNGSGAPSGIFIGAGPATPGPVAVVGKPPTAAAAPNFRAIMAAALPPASIPRETTPGPVIQRPDAQKIEDKVFAGKRYYSMVINMPNLTSAGGSWIIRFAELSDRRQAGELSAPVATHKVDPAYPADLVRARVQGTVTLYAVIRSDGTVGEVRVLRGLDDKLDENARLALSRWVFRPATKNGAGVDLEAVVQIPFAVPKLGF